MAATVYIYIHIYNVLPLYINYYFHYFLFKGFTYVAPSILEDMHRVNRMPARSPRRTPRQHHEGSYRMQFPPQRGIYPRATPPHLQAFPPRPSPQDEMMDVQGVPIV